MIKPFEKLPSIIKQILAIGAIVIAVVSGREIGIVALAGLNKFLSSHQIYSGYAAGLIIIVVFIACIVMLFKLPINQSLASVTEKSNVSIKEISILFSSSFGFGFFIVLTFWSLSVIIAWF
jgi:hypothetical protein